MDALAVRQLLAEISPALEGAQVESARRLGESSVAIRLRRGDAARSLCVSTARSVGVLCVIDGTPPSAGESESRLETLEREIRGADLMSIAQPGWQPRIDLTFVRVDGAGRGTERVLSINLGRDPWLALADPRGRATTLMPIGKTSRRGSGRRHKSRSGSPDGGDAGAGAAGAGEPAERSGLIPPGDPSAPFAPADISGAAIRNWGSEQGGFPMGVWEFIRALERHLPGLEGRTALDAIRIISQQEPDRADAQEASKRRPVDRSNSESPTRIEQIDDSAMLDTLADALREMYEGTSPLLEPTVVWWRDRSGSMRARLSPVEPVWSPGEKKRFASFNEAAGFIFTELRPTIETEVLRARTVAAISTQRRRKERALLKVRNELAEADRADEYRKNAQLLLTRKDDVRRGASRVRLLDFDNRTVIEFGISPMLTPAQNAEALFRRAKRVERRMDRAPRRLEELESELETLTRAESRAATASGQDLEGIAETYLTDRGGRVGRRPDEKRARVRRYGISGGWQVLVGKSNVDNDILTHSIAAPDDIWFHASQSPGSHVVLRRAGSKKEPDTEALLEAAAIAAYHSKAGKSSKVAVCYTKARFVRKPRRAKPGTAVVANEKVVMVRPKLPRPSHDD